MDSLPPVALSPREDHAPKRPDAGKWRAHVLRFVIVVLPLVFGIGRANASLWVLPHGTKDPLEDRALRADAVPIGTATGVTASWEGQHIVTLVTFRVRDTLKGDLPSEIVLKVRGGTVGGIGERVSGAPVFTAGESSLLFLRNLGEDPKSPRYGVLDRALGKMDIAKEGEKEMVSWVRPDLQRVDRVRLTELAERVKAALRKASP
jgi:hypothetical protein